MCVTQSVPAVKSYLLQAAWSLEISRREAFLYYKDLYRKDGKKNKMVNKKKHNSLLKWNRDFHIWVEHPDQNVKECSPTPVSETHTHTWIL